MHLAVHVTTALPFLWAGIPAGALGAIAPDITWTLVELSFRKSKAQSWYRWSESITDRQMRPYRVAHSFLVLSIVWALSSLLSAPPYVNHFILGWMLHITLDLPTHWGALQPRPLYPFSYRWPYVFSYIKKRFEAQ